MLKFVRTDTLCRVVERLSIPWNYVAETAVNRQIGEWIAARFGDFGYEVTIQEPHRNVIAYNRESPGGGNDRRPL